jgi:hypothetical protein
MKEAEQTQRCSDCMIPKIPLEAGVLEPAQKPRFTVPKPLQHAHLRFPNPPRGMVLETS